MAMGQKKRKDYLDKSRQLDRPPVVDLAESIRQVRRIYKDYDDAEFAAWYGTRYGVRAAAVLAVINADKKGGGGGGQGGNTQ